MQSCSRLPSCEGHRKRVFDQDTLSCEGHRKRAFDQDTLLHQWFPGCRWSCCGLVRCWVFVSVICLLCCGRCVRSLFCPGVNVGRLCWFPCSSRRSFASSAQVKLLLEVSRQQTSSWQAVCCLCGEAAVVRPSVCCST